MKDYSFLGVPKCSFDLLHTCSSSKKCPIRKQIEERGRKPTHQVEPRTKTRWNKENKITYCGLWLRIPTEDPVPGQAANKPYPSADPSITIYLQCGFDYREILTVDSKPSCYRCTTMVKNLIPFYAR